MLLELRHSRQQRLDLRCQLRDRRALLGNRRRLLGNTAVSPIMRQDSLSACAAASWKAILHAELEIDLTQCGMGHMD